MYIAFVPTIMLQFENIRDVVVSSFFQGALSATVMIAVLMIIWRFQGVKIRQQLTPVRRVFLSDRLGRYLRIGWIRKGVMLGYAAILGLFLIAVLEWYQVIDLIPLEEENQLTRMAPVFGAFGTIALTFGLVILYDRQARVLAQQYKPHLAADIVNNSPMTSQFVVRNTGDDYAYDIQAQWDVAGQTRTWEKPSLAPGDSASFPIVIDEDDRWLLNTNQIDEYLENNDSTKEIDFELICEDQFDLPHRFTGTVDFEVMKRRQDAREIWEVNPIESMADSLTSLEASVEQLASDYDDRRDEHEWEDRWSKLQSIKQIVNEVDEIEIEVLARMMNTRVGSLEYRVSELEEVGVLHYNKRSGLIKKGLGPGTNYQLSDFP